MCACSSNLRTIATKYKWSHSNHSFYCFYAKITGLHFFLLYLQRFSLVWWLIIFNVVYIQSFFSMVPPSSFENQHSALCLNCRFLCIYVCVSEVLQFINCVLLEPVSYLLSFGAIFFPLQTLFAWYLWCSKVVQQFLCLKRPSSRENFPFVWLVGVNGKWEYNHQIVTISSF